VFEYVGMPAASSRDPIVRQLAGGTGPATLAAARRLPVLEPLEPLLPGGLQRGTVVSVAGSAGGGATTLALALAAGPSSAGSFVAAINLPDVGVGAARELGVALERFALISCPDRAFAEATATLVDGIDVMLLRPPASLPPTVARRLQARVRERGAVLVTLGSWPALPDLGLAVTRRAWLGLGRGHGHLRERHAEVTAAGRGMAVRARRAWLLLPGATGAVEALPATNAVDLDLDVGRPAGP